MLLTRSIFTPVFFAILFIFSQAAANPWQDLARADLAFVHDQIDMNHPGAVNPDDAHVRQWLDHGYADALAQLPNVSSLSDYRLILNAFSAGFRDPHVGISLGVSQPDLQWPQFVVAGRAGKVTIVGSSMTTPAVGAELVACDGVPVDQLLTKRVFAFGGNPAVEASFDREVRELFFYSRNSFFARLQTCRFTNKGSAFDVELEWKDVTPQAWRMFENADGEVFGSPSLSEPMDGIYWLAVPSFSADGNNKMAMENLFRKINQMQNTMAESKALVIDVRGNGGGTDALVERLTYLLFDKDTLRKAGESKQEPIEIDWRASAGNLADAQTWLDPANSRYHANQAFIRGFIDGLKSAFDQKRDYFRQTVEAETFREDPSILPYWYHQGDPSTKQFPAFVPAVPVKAKIFVLTDGACASACLDFLDNLKRFEGIRYLGLPTDADTQYNDTRSMELPSQLGKISFPMKVYRTRVRKPGQVYEPDLKFRGLQRDQKDMRDWALDVVSKSVGDASR